LIDRRFRRPRRVPYLAIGFRNSPTALRGPGLFDFVDTESHINVFVYAADPRDPSKQGRARQWIAHLWQERLGRTSIQVLSEYYAVATRKLTPHVPPERAWDYVEVLFAWQPQPVDAALL
jgi:hypothetical protein